MTLKNKFNTFEQFGKISDIDFDRELFNEYLNPFSDEFIREINFEDNTVTLGIEEETYCECCGPELIQTTYTLEELLNYGKLTPVILLMNKVLDDKGIGC